MQANCCQQERRGDLQRGDNNGANGDNVSQKCE